MQPLSQEYVINRVYQQRSGTVSDSSDGIAEVKVLSQCYSIEPPLIRSVEPSGGRWSWGGNGMFNSSVNLLTLQIAA